MRLHISGLEAKLEDKNQDIKDEMVQLRKQLRQYKEANLQMQCALDAQADRRQGKLIIFVTFVK